MGTCWVLGSIGLRMHGARPGGTLVFPVVCACVSVCVCACVRVWVSV